MTSINRLTNKPSLEDKDLIPVWDAESGRTRNITAESIKDYIPDIVPHVISGTYESKTLTLNLSDDSEVVVSGWTDLTQSEVIDIYKSFRSFSGIAMPVGVTQSIELPAAASESSFSILHLPFATEGGEIRGDAFTANSDGTITCNKDMFAISVTCYANLEYVSSKNVVVGIGIGDPLQIPTFPGNQVGENYVSRFQFSSYGNGINKPITTTLTVEPVGKSTTQIEQFGVKSGDKIFPTIYTTNSPASVDVDVKDLIFTIQEISV